MQPQGREPEAENRNSINFQIKILRHAAELHGPVHLQMVDCVGQQFREIGDAEALTMFILERTIKTCHYDIIEKSFRQGNDSSRDLNTLWIETVVRIYIQVIQA
jgi:hypothetical protein